MVVSEFQPLASGNQSCLGLLPPHPLPRTREGRPLLQAALLVALTKTALCPVSLSLSPCLCSFCYSVNRSSWRRYWYCLETMCCVWLHSFKCNHAYHFSADTEKTMSFQCKIIRSQHRLALCLPIPSVHCMSTPRFPTLPLSRFFPSIDCQSFIAMSLSPLYS